MSVSKHLLADRSDHIEDRIAEEAQLLAEEKWIIEALTKIKNQRNCLQIERLQLESLQAKLQKPDAKTPKETKSEAQKTSTVTTFTGTIVPAKTFTAQRSRNSIEFEVPLPTKSPKRLVDLDTCNNEELDLAVSKSMFGQEFKNNLMEEDEEDDDDILIDMDIFMNSN